MKETTINYRGFVITIKEHHTRFGVVYFASNNYGEPYQDRSGFSTFAEALAWDKKNLDSCIDQ